IPFVGRVKVQKGRPRSREETDDEVRPADLRGRDRVRLGARGPETGPPRAVRGLLRRRGRPRHDAGRRAAPHHGLRDHGPGAERRDPGGGWTVRRDEGTTGRILPRRMRERGRGDRAGGQDPRRTDRGGGGAPDRGGPGAAAPVTPADARDLAGRLFRDEWGRVVATLVRVLGDFDLAEEAVQEAFAVALERWPVQGVPSNPGAWITTTARNKAIDRLRRERRLSEKRKELERMASEEAGAQEARVAETATGGDSMAAIPDDRLQLIFGCCHPGLALQARVALTL